MTLRTVLAGLAGLVVAAISCTPTSRYEILSTVFDGVPTPGPAEPPGGPVAGGAAAARKARVKPQTHGPYAARLCSACHDSASTNAFVVPREQLCFQCHEVPFDKKYVHGPLASGGCTACHDPHGSGYRYLLVAESDNFCGACHEPQALARVGRHVGVEGQCTDCHDAHMSDKPFLLK